MQQPRWDDRDERLERDEYIIEHDPYEQHDQYDQYNQGASSYGHGYNYYENNYETNNVDPNYPNYTYNNTSNAHSTSHDNNHYYDQFYDANGAPIGGVPGGQRTSAYSTESRIDYSNPNYGFGKHYHTSQSTHDNGAYDPAYHGAVNSYYEGKYDESFPYALGASGASDPKTGGGFLAANERDIKDEELRSQNAFSRALARVFGSNVEARGIERVPEDERDGKHTIGLLLLWWSVNCVVSTFPIGLLAQAYFKLSFRMAVTAIVVFSAIGSACCGFIATLGPKTGLRTIVISRYSVGFVGGTILAVLNILTQLGFSCIAVILGGQVLTNVSEQKLPLEASIVIVGLLGLILCFVGYEAVHYWERYAWTVQTAFYICILVLAGKKGFNVNNSQSSLSSGAEFAGGFLTFGGIVFSSAAGWAPIAADFNCRLPSHISSWKVFILTWFGLMVPLLFIEITSAAVMTVPQFAAVFETGDAGGVLFDIFRPWGAGGKAVLVLMAFSIVANIAPNTYSASLSAQTLMPLFQKIPRAIWCIFMFCAYTGSAIGGREHLSEVLSNFLAILGYWVAFFIVVLAEEHFIFRRRLKYDLTAYNSLSRLPVGIAGIIACCCGVGCAVVGMAQVWFIGPVGKLIGPEGGDLGFEMCAVATAIVYPPLRWIELKVFKR